MTSDGQSNNENGKFQLEDLLTADTNLFARILKLGLQQLMELERDEYIGAGRHERSEDRRTTRNGYKPRQLYTRVGTLNLRVPKTRDGVFYPSIFERYQRSEKALVSALAEAYVQGVSTRSMKQVTEKLLGKEFSSGVISDYAEQLDTELDAWRDRPLEKWYPYVLLDARFERARRDGQIVDMAVLVAIGVSESGHREVIGVETGWGESEQVWSDFVEDLKQRGLKQPDMFTSDAHPGIRAAIRAHYPGAAWQRCQYHFLQNAVDKAPNSREDELRKALKEVWAKDNDYEQAQERLQALINEWADPVPDVADWLSEEAEATLTVFQKAPVKHRVKMRTTNSVERLHQELKRRSKAVRIFPNPASCLRLFGAMLKEQHEDWISGNRRYIKMEELKKFKKEKTSCGF